jgi:hypothetical protein
MMAFTSLLSQSLQSGICGGGGGGYTFGPLSVAVEVSDEDCAVSGEMPKVKAQRNVGMMKRFMGRRRVEGLKVEGLKVEGLKVGEEEEDAARSKGLKVEGRKRRGRG